MQGSVRQRGGSWEYRLELGLQPAQRCSVCGRVYWLDGRVHSVCEFGGDLADVHARRQLSRGGFRLKRDAEEALNEARHAFDRGEYVKPSRLTVSEYLVREWLPGIALSKRPSTHAAYRGAVERYLLPILGSVRLQALTPEGIEAAYRQLLESGRVRVCATDGARGLSPRTVRHVHAVLHHALDDAVKRHRLAVSPADYVNLPATGAAEREMVAWTPEQVAAFLEATKDDRLAALWRLLASSGLRRGEALGLTWDDVDLDSGRLAVRRSLSSVGYAVSVQAPKTRRGRRTVALGGGLVKALRKHAARQSEESGSWPEDVLARRWVFTTPDGEHLHPDRISKAFVAATQAAGLPRIRLHDLRHTFATSALRAGVDIKTLSSALGHASIGVTCDVYAHVDDTMRADAADRVEALYEVAQ